MTGMGLAAVRSLAVQHRAAQPLLAVQLLAPAHSSTQGCNRQRRRSGAAHPAGAMDDGIGKQAQRPHIPSWRLVHLFYLSRAGMLQAEQLPW